MATDHTDPRAKDRLFVAVVTTDRGFLDAVATGLTNLTLGSRRAFRHDTDGAGGIGQAGPPQYADAVRRARRYLDRALPCTGIDLVAGTSLESVRERLVVEIGRHEGVRRALALVLVDAATTSGATHPGDGWTDRLAALWRRLPPTVEAEMSPYTTFVYDDHDSGVQIARDYTVRHPAAEPWVLAADVVCAFTDFVQMRYSGLTAHLSGSSAPRTLALALHDFLRDHAGSSWGLHYFTGSTVSGLIYDLEGLARANGNPVLRGPTEHSLACGALARWQLDRAPYLIVVTSGMVDEFRGTLANLQAARAPGFIVCGEAAPGRWSPFQGTVHTTEDARDVVRARGLPVIYLDRAERLDQDLRSAFGAFARGHGPVVLLATPAALDATVPPPARTASPPDASTRASTSVADGESVDAVVRTLNRERATLLWQCGQLTADEADLVLEIARRAAIGLVDSLAHPGVVSRYRDGRLVEEYLGTLGLYAYSARVYDYLHHGGRLKPRDEQYLLFLNSRIPEIATPFSERVLSRGLRVAQVIHDARDRAPFADQVILADPLAFLRTVRERLDVGPEILRFRQNAIRATHDSPSDVISALPVRPMSVNYFFRRLGTVLERLITSEGYTYTGVFDVGRGGLSAVRNLPRTGPGFSGWYGRALMGDGLEAVPTIALTRPGNVLAFVGDGAAALVPDVLPTLVHQVCVGGAQLRGNLSVFRLVDGGHSLIRTYREARQSAPAGYQATLAGLVDDDWCRRFGPLEVNHRRLIDVDASTLADQLQRPSTVNLYSVVLGHNNEGDGLSLLASLGWQRDEPLELGSPPTRERPTMTPVGSERGGGLRD
jgi:thiamine pyrophosphate-dependent acetolactate synthase large subunit-like protein